MKVSSSAAVLPLSDGGADPFEVALLRSARADGALGHPERTLAALAVLTATTAAGVASGRGASRGVGQRLGALKWPALMGVVVVGAVAGLASYRHRSPAADTALATIPQSQPAAGDAVTPPAAAAPAPTAQPQVVKPARSVARSTPRAAQTTPALPIDSLREEVAILDGGRVQLLQQDGAAATRTAEQYLARFPKGRLASEAEVLRIRAALLLGGPSAAAPLAAAFLRAHPDSPHAPALRKLLPP